VTPEEKTAIKAEVEKRIEETRNSIETLREQTAPVPPSVAIGRLTRMDAIQQKSMAESNLKTAEATISNLKKVLARIEEPDFGVCAVCGNDMPIQRILAVPDAKICVPCASKKRR